MTTGTDITSPPMCGFLASRTEGICSFFLAVKDPPRTAWGATAFVYHTITAGEALECTLSDGTDSIDECRGRTKGLG